jgi:hypothetical protein
MFKKIMIREIGFQSRNKDFVEIGFTVQVEFQFHSIFNKEQQSSEQQLILFVR